MLHPHRFRLPRLVHEGERLAEGDRDRIIVARCWDRNHPAYMQARSLDDERCEACGRWEMPPNLHVLDGGRS